MGNSTGNFQQYWDICSSRNHGRMAALSGIGSTRASAKKGSNGKDSGPTAEISATSRTMTTSTPMDSFCPIAPSIPGLTEVKKSYASIKVEPVDLVNGKLEFATSTISSTSASFTATGRCRKTERRFKAAMLRSERSAARQASEVALNLKQPDTGPRGGILSYRQLRVGARRHRGLQRATS